MFFFPHTGAKSIIQEFPDITILTTEVHPVAPTHFGQRYFGTDWSEDIAKDANLLSSALGIFCSFCFTVSFVVLVPKNASISKVPRFNRIDNIYYFFFLAVYTPAKESQETLSYVMGWSLMILFCMLQYLQENKEFIFVNIKERNGIDSVFLLSHAWRTGVEKAATFSPVK